MATAIVTGDRIFIKFVCQLEDQFSYNIRPYLLVGPAAGMTDQHVVDWFAEEGQDRFCPLLPQEAIYRGCLAYIRRAGGNLGGVQKEAPLIGGFGSGVASLQVAGLVSLRTGVSGRKGRGRLYVPFVPVGGMTTTGHFTNEYKLRLRALGDWMSGVRYPSFTGGHVDAYPIVWHRGDDTHDQILYGKHNKNPATQRRRTYLKHSDVDPFE